MLTKNGNLVITAAELTIGDVVRHLGQAWEIYTEPKYTKRGISFEVLCLDFGETQSVTFHPQWKFELVTHNVIGEEVAA